MTIEARRRRASCFSGVRWRTAGRDNPDDRVLTASNVAGNSMRRIVSAGATLQASGADADSIDSNGRIDPRAGSVVTGWPHAP